MGGGNAAAHSAATRYGTASTIGGGYGNLTSADAGYGTIGGGQQNQITATAGTNLNIATIGGGYNNKSHAGRRHDRRRQQQHGQRLRCHRRRRHRQYGQRRRVDVPGGNSNLAQGNTSFAAGYRAKSLQQRLLHVGRLERLRLRLQHSTMRSRRAPRAACISSRRSMAPAQPPPACRCRPAATRGRALSDRNSKANFAAVDARAVVEKLAQIPISTWNYKTQDAAIRHIGPMAQDFAAAFGVGEDDTHITTIDADGVSLAAIQGLYQIVQEKDQRIAQLESEVAQLKNGGAAHPINLSTSSI